VFREPTNDDVAEILRLKADRYTRDAIASKLNLDPSIVRRVFISASKPEPVETPTVGAVDKLEHLLDRLA
jgi:hypothetical protein